MAKILFIETNPVGLDVILEAKKLGHFVFFITSDLGYYLRDTTINNHPLGMVDKILEVPSTYYIESLISYIEKYLPYKEIEAIITLSEIHSNVVAHLAKHFEVAGLSPEAADLARNKYLTRETLSEFNIPSPQYKYVETLEEALDSVNSIGYPVIMKPINGTGSLFVRVNHSEKDVKAYFEESENIKYFGRSVPKNKGFLMEEFIGGELISVETVSFKGSHQIIGITRRQLEGYPYFIEVESIFPAQIAQEKEINKLTVDILNSLGINFGFCHLEFILSSNGPIFIEINPRLAGGVIPKLMELSRGINISKNLINLYLYEEINLNGKSINVTGSYHFTSKKEGILNEILGWEEIKSRESVQESIFMKPLGSELKGLKSNFDRLGYVIIKGESETVVSNEILKVKGLFSVNTKTH